MQYEYIPRWPIHALAAPSEYEYIDERGEGHSWPDFLSRSCSTNPQRRAKKEKKTGTISVAAASRRPALWWRRKPEIMALHHGAPLRHVLLRVAMPIRPDSKHLCASCLGENEAPPGPWDLSTTTDQVVKLQPFYGSRATEQDKRPTAGLRDAASGSQAGQDCVGSLWGGTQGTTRRTTEWSSWSRRIQPPPAEATRRPRPAHDAESRALTGCSNAVFRSSKAA